MKNLATTLNLSSTKEMENPPLHLCTPRKSWILINRSHMFIHSIALAAIIYYRASSFLYYSSSGITILIPWLMVFGAELLLTFLWVLLQAFRWRPVHRTVFPERLPGDEQLPAIDVFVVTADPKNEPAVGVMNTVLSAMALDYPQEKISVYLSDDAGSPVTLYALRETWAFSKLWLPFCTAYKIKCRGPEAYFSDTGNQNQGDVNGAELAKQRENIKRKYELFRENLIRAGEDIGKTDTSNRNAKNHPAVIEVMNENSDDAAAKMPRLVYVSREKRPSHPHNFKAGALNGLIKVSAVISNSPYILSLDCDMLCNDPTSARQAMCFHLDPKITSSLGFVQFPQKFHNICENDIYEGQLRPLFKIMWQGMDGLRGPILSGTGFYMKRRTLYGTPTQNVTDGIQLRETFGPSNEFIKSLGGKEGLSSNWQKEAQFLASCAYEKSTQWGKKIGFLYDSVAEDVFTGFIIHCKGWNSVYCDPQNPTFMGSATINLNDMIVQNTRWSAGLLETGFSKYCPLLYGPIRMSLIESMCYAFMAFRCLYSFPLWCLAIIPQLCLINGVSLYPKVSDSWFMLFSFVFISALFKHLEEILITGGSAQTWWNEQRDWMIKSITAHFFGSLDAILSKVGVREANFMATNKIPDDEQEKRYQMGQFDFRTSTMILAPMVSLVILNIVSLVIGITRVVIYGTREMEGMFGQMFLSFFILLVNYPIIDGMIFRRDKGRVPPSTTLFSLVLVVIFLSLGSFVLMF